MSEKNESPIYVVMLYLEKHFEDEIHIVKEQEVSRASAHSMAESSYHASRKALKIWK